MILKNYIFSLVSGDYQQYTSDCSETFIKQFCTGCRDTHQVAVHRDGNLMYYIYLYRKDESSVYGLCVVSGEICLNLQWLFESMQKTLEASACKGVLFSYDKQGRICKNVVNYANEAAEVDNLFRDVKDCLEKRPAYWGSLPSEDLSIPLTSGISLAFNDDDNSKITEALRHYHNVVVTMENIIPSSFSQTILRLNSENDQLRAEKSGLEDEMESLKRQKKQYKWVVVLSVLLAVGLIAIVSFNQNVNRLHSVVEDMNKSIDSLNVVVSGKNQAIADREETIERKDGEIRTLRQDKDELQSEFDEAKSILENVVQQMPVFIYGMEVRTGDTIYGEKIHSKSTTYIYSKIELYSLVEGSVDFYVKFFAPNGLSTSSSSDYSYKVERVLSKFKKQTVDLSGWGRETKGYWSSGSYRIEVWLKGKCLYEKKFTIYD